MPAFLLSTSVVSLQVWVLRQLKWLHLYEGVLQKCTLKHDTAYAESQFSQV